MNRRNMIRTVGASALGTVLLDQSWGTEGGYGAGSDDSGTGTSPPGFVDSSVSVSVSRYDEDVGVDSGLEFAVDSDDERVVLLSGELVFENSDLDMSVVSVDVDNENGVVDVLTHMSPRDGEYPRDVGSTVVGRGGGGGGVESGVSSRYVYEVSGELEFDQSVAGYDFSA